MPERTTYLALFRIPAFPRLAAGVVLGRTALQMMQLAIILFVLQRFHSPSLAGITVFLGLAPGIAMSPLAGALLDRHGRVRLMTLDYLVGAVVLGSIAALDWIHNLTPIVLLPIVTVGSLTFPLSNSGARSLVPLIVPKPLWDRANALDSIAYAVTTGAGPALAGALTAWAGPRVALLTTGAVYLLAALLIVRLPDPRVERKHRPVLREALAAIRYVVIENQTLRGIVLMVSLLNLGAGMLIVALPVMVFERLHGNAAFVGELWAIYGFASIPSAWLAGRFNTEGRERVIMAACIVVTAFGIALIAIGSGGWIVGLAMLLQGLANGPFDVAMFSLRQRRTDPAWFGRAFAVSMGLNFAGQPLGSALSGPLIQLGLTLTFITAALVTLAGAAIVPWVVPGEDLGKIDTESARQSRRDRPVEESPSSAEQGAG